MYYKVLDKSLKEGLKYLHDTILGLMMASSKHEKGKEATWKLHDDDLKKNDFDFVSFYSLDFMRYRG